METFLLNSNNTTLNPAAPQEGMPGTQTDTSGEFSPIMDDAAANLENEQPQPNPESELNTENSESALLDGTASAFVADKADTSTLFGAINNAVISSDTTETQVTGQATTIATTVAAIPEQAKEQNPLQPQSLFKPEKTETQPALPLQGENDITATPSKAESILLQQIQQILDQGKDSGVIVIRGNDLAQGKGINQADSLQNLSTPVLADTENGDIQAKQVGIPLTIVDEATVATQKTAKLEGVHQEVSEQYLNAKIDQSKGSSNESSEKNNAGQKGSDQQSKPEIQQTAISQNTTVPDAKPVESSFGQQLGQFVTTNDPTTSVEGKFAPGANTPVPEKELVNNLIQRFNVNPRLQTSKLSMQLNPAELGSLKIDILVEGDSIKANIVAQSQQVLDLLEKNMPRLRTVLEEQGFKVNAFEISMNAVGGQQKDFFQEQFSSQQQEFTSSGSSSRKNESFDVLMDSQSDSEENDEDTSGVNLTV